MSGQSPPIPSPDSTTSHQSQTTLHNDVTPNPNPKPRPRKTTPFPVRDDCWSEDGTFTLIEAWGERIIKLNTGSLRQNHWQEVADAVNAAVKKTQRSCVQCKNRIDTLKKKYKVEKALVMELGADNYVSPWPFFASLDSVIGTSSSSIKPLTKTPSSVKPLTKTLSSFKPSMETPSRPTPPPPSVKSTPAVVLPPPPPTLVPVGRRSKRPPATAYQASDGSVFRRNFSVMAAVGGAEDDLYSESGSETELDRNQNRNRKGNSNRNRNGNNGNMNNGNGNREGRRGNGAKARGDVYGELAEAIGRFAEVYKRVEEGKQRQMVELEKQRMQFTKDLEIERIKLLMESQVQLQKLKRLKTSSDLGFMLGKLGFMYTRLLVNALRFCAEVVTQLASAEAFGRSGTFSC
ncbi:hypothetical protein M8C21_001790 [Ambrosia artemisiifolia]|uniref:Myb/SANT-like DNA-binding domain-containing protein n=1 Tax=Ambrosia artemisiifolia TaxID=4212 RepID=A0AAD5CNV1_AMBAR|nr:hypothetical protein M8C21_001790 [Ambrosia artemisiifolia]